MREVILALIALGESDARVAELTAVSVGRLRRLAKSDAAFGAALEKARAARNGTLAQALRMAMVAQIAKGQRWWAKLAIHNYPVLLKDPDVAEALQADRGKKKRGGQKSAVVVRVRPERGGNERAGSEPTGSERGEDVKG